MAWRKPVVSKEAVKLKQQYSFDSEDSTSCTDDTNITDLINSRRSSKDPDNSSLPMSMQNFLPSQDSSEEIENDEEDSEPEDWIHSLDQIGTKGLTCLENLDRLVIRHQVELIEIFMGCERRNKFKIQRGNQNLLFSGQEETDFCTRLCLGTSFRPFDIVLGDENGRQVMNMTRNICTLDPCCCCCFGCSPCLQTMDVYGGGRSHPANIFLGRVEQCCSMFRPKFRLLNEKSETILKIRGRQGFWPSILLCRNVDFDIFAKPDKSLVHVEAPAIGRISRKTGGFFSKETCRGDGDNFEIVFPKEMDVKMKGVVIGACILITLMYFENYPAQQQVIKKSKQK